jgi:hypothetical protein
MARCTNPFVKEPSKNCPKVTEFGSLEVCDACDDYQSEPPAQMICKRIGSCPLRLLDGTCDSDGGRCFKSATRFKSRLADSKVPSPSIISQLGVGR